MAYFAKIFAGIVEQVVSVSDDDVADFVSKCPDSPPYVYKQASYRTYHGVHFGDDGNPDGGTAVRGNFPGPTFVYDEVNDVFYPPSPFPSWKLDKTIWDWVAPTPMPTDGARYNWDESSLSWKAVT